MDYQEDGYDWLEVEFCVPGIFRKSTPCDVDLTDSVAVGDGDRIRCHPEHFFLVLSMVITQHATLYNKVAYVV